MRADEGRRRPVCPSDADADLLPPTAPMEMRPPQATRPQISSELQTPVYREQNLITKESEIRLSVLLNYLRNCRDVSVGCYDSCSNRYRNRREVTPQQDMTSALFGAA